MSIYTLSYHSRTHLENPSVDPNPELMDILNISRVNNQKANVTGALMFNEKCFVQILEGPKGAVEDIFQRVEIDRRHHSITVLALQTVPERRFGEWSMAFVGRTKQARAYYWYFTRQERFQRERMGNDVVYQLMLNMMDLDRASFLSGISDI